MYICTTFEPMLEPAMDMDIPTDYRAGFAKARLVDADMATRYVTQTMVGDPLADAVMLACDSAPPARQHAWIQRGIEGGAAAIPDAPGELRALITEVERVPPWYDAAATLPGCRAFHGKSEIFFAAFVGAVLIEGFSTMISKSFSLTGRLVDQGERRLKQNNRHLAEIFLPGGLERHGEGWSLSVRIRLIHARVRLLLSRSDEWDTAAWGVPMSGAHIAYAAAAFSGLLLHRARMLGLSITQEESESFMRVWHYAAHLMGVDPTVQCPTEAEAMRMYRIGLMCEPPPGLESIQLANLMVNSAPVVAGVTDPAKRAALVRRIYSVSRSIIGDELADTLRFPRGGPFYALTWLRFQNQADGLLRRVFPALEQRRRVSQFGQAVDFSYYEPVPDPAAKPGLEADPDAPAPGGINYTLPQHLHAEKDKQF